MGANMTYVIAHYIAYVARDCYRTLCMRADGDATCLCRDLARLACDASRAPVKWSHLASRGCESRR